MSGAQKRHQSRYPAFITVLAEAALCALVIIASARCSSERPFSITSSSATHDSRGITVHFSTSAPASGVTIRSDSGTVLLRRRLAGLNEVDVTIAAPENPVTRLRMQVNAEDGRSAETSLAPVGESAEQPLRIRSPFEAGFRSESLLLAAGAAATILIEAPGAQRDQSLNVAVDGNAVLSSDGKTWSASLALPPENAARSHWIVSLLPRGKSGGGVISARLTASVSGEEIAVATRQFEIADAESLGNAVGISAFEMPVDSRGVRRETARADELVIDDSSRFAGVGDGITSVMRPLAYQAVRVHNRLSRPVPVIVAAGVLDHAGGQPAAAFETPPEIPGPIVRSAGIVPANGELTLTMPIYGEAGAIAPGSYAREAKLYFAGTSLQLDRAEAPLTVERGGGVPMLVTIVCVLVSAAALLFMVFGGSAGLARFSTRQIILIGLFAAVSVVVVTAPAWLVTSVTMILLGPMGFVVDGIFSVFLFYCLLAVLVSLAPRPGVCAALVATRFLLGAVMLGMVTPVGVIHNAVTAVLLEGALWLRRRLPAARDSQGVPQFDFLAILFVAIANTAVSWIGFQLSITIYRMYYADWYLVLSVALGGFLYALAGAWLGRGIGRVLSHAVA